jgi:hypothetical protein
MIRIADIADADEAEILLGEIDEQEAAGKLDAGRAGRYRAAVGIRTSELAAKPPGKRGGAR